MSLFGQFSDFERQGEISTYTFDGVDLSSTVRECAYECTSQPNSAVILNGVSDVPLRRDQSGRYEHNGYIVPPDDKIGPMATASQLQLSEIVEACMQFSGNDAARPLLERAPFVKRPIERVKPHTSGLIVIGSFAPSVARLDDSYLEIAHRPEDSVLAFEGRLEDDGLLFVNVPEVSQQEWPLIELRTEGNYYGSGILRFVDSTD